MIKDDSLKILDSLQDLLNEMDLFNMTEMFKEDDINHLNDIIKNAKKTINNNDQVETPIEIDTISKDEYTKLNKDINELNNLIKKSSIVFDKFKNK